MSASSFSPTAAMPLPPSPEHASLLEVVNDFESLVMGVYRLPDLAARLKEDAALKTFKFNMDDTVGNLHNAVDNDVRSLFHAMSPAAIRSIIQGTVAFDSANAEGWYPMPSKKDERAPGVYVIGLRSAADGKFMTEANIRKVSQGIRDYLEGCEIISQVSPGTRDAGQRKKVKWVSRVDKAFAPPSQRFDEDQPKFNSSRDDDLILRGTADMLDRRCPNPVDSPNTTARQEQSPLYTGGSVDLAECTAVYDPKTYYSGVNKPLGITISIARLFGITLAPVIRIAILTWEPTHLAPAEQLVLALADGLVSHRGFNAKEAGVSSAGNTSAEMDSAARYVFQSYNILDNNVSASLKEIDNRCKFVDNLSSANAILDALEDSVTRLEAQLADVPEEDNLHIEPFEVVKARLEEQVRRKRERLQALLEEERQATFVLKTAKLVKPELFAKALGTLDLAGQRRIRNLIGDDPGPDAGDKVAGKGERPRIGRKRRRITMRTRTIAGGRLLRRRRRRSSRLTTTIMDRWLELSTVVCA